MSCGVACVVMQCCEKSMLCYVVDEWCCGMLCCEVLWHLEKLRPVMLYVVVCCHALYYEKGDVACYIHFVVG